MTSAPDEAIASTDEPAPLNEDGRSGAMRAPDIDLSVLVQSANDRHALERLLPDLRAVLDRLAIRYEVLLLLFDGEEAPADSTRAPHVHVSRVPHGYGTAFTTALARAAGAYVMTVDADACHVPELVERLWTERGQADVTIASRYVPGGSADVPRLRRAFSRLLNGASSRGLDVPIRDLSSGFRLYRAPVLREQQITSEDFDVLQQTIVQAFAEGWRVREVPFRYVPRPGAASRQHLAVAMAWLRQFGALWLLRNSILAADYDFRAHDSRIPLQRYWQRSRFRHIVDLMSGEGAVLDVGCGSSHIIGSLPPGSVAVDVLHRKLRFARRFGKPLVRASGFALPFRDESFPCVVCSQVIEHVPKESPILDELCRVLKVGGRLVLGTPDYANWQWVYMEKLYGLVPGGYKDEHISHYTNAELVRIMERRGLQFEEERYILRGELIQAFRKRRRGEAPAA